MRLLDRLVWSGPSTAHAGLSVGGELARRHRLEIDRFASVRYDSEAALVALDDLFRPSERVHRLQAPGIVLTSALSALTRARCALLVCMRTRRPCLSEALHDRAGRNRFFLAAVRPRRRGSAV